MKQQRLKGVVQILSPATIMPSQPKVSVGITTLCETLIQELPQLSGGNNPAVLVLDTSPNRGLALRLCAETPEHTLLKLVEGFLENPQATNEAIDWAFRDLTVAHNADVDVLVTGLLPASESVPSGILKMLGYGLQRLMADYDYVVIDGYQSLLAALMPEAMEGNLLNVLVVMTPAVFAGLDFLPQALQQVSVSLLINRDTLSANQSSGDQSGFDTAINDWLSETSAPLVGRLPEYADERERLQQLPLAFRNSLLRLNLPLSPLADV